MNWETFPLKRNRWHVQCDEELYTSGKENYVRAAEVLTGCKVQHLKVVVFPGSSITEALWMCLTTDVHSTLFCYILVFNSGC